MRSLFLIFYRIIRKTFVVIYNIYSVLSVRFIFWIYNVKVGSEFHTNGLPLIYINQSSTVILGKNLKLNNGSQFNPIGRQEKCLFAIGKNAELIIGDNVGLSGTAIVTQNFIKIGNNVKIGGNTVIYDTDFHSLNINDRCMKVEDEKRVNTKPVEIGNGVFIGAHSTILKGVRIGEYSIIGACSVVTKDIPSGQIWGGNPAKFIKNVP